MAHFVLFEGKVDAMLPQWEAYMRSALRAQSQCRMTLEALAEMKNPKAITFFRQANIANGPQQVDNGDPSSSRAHAGESGTSPTELLEEHDAEWMDARTTSKASRADQAVEAVGAIDRSAH